MTLLERASQIDAGSDINVLPDMIAALDRLSDDEIPTRRLLRSRPPSVLRCLAIRADNVSRVRHDQRQAASD